MTLKEVLKFRNVHGKPYMVDIEEWLKDKDGLEELQNLLGEIDDRKNQKW